MKKLLLSVLFIFVAVGLHAQVTLYNQNFEGPDMSGYQLFNSGGGAVGFASTGIDYIQRAPTAGLPLGNAVSGFSGNVIALEDHDGAGFFGQHYIQTDAVDISGATGLSFTFRLAAPRGSDGNRYEPGDFLQVQYAIDGGAFQTLINTGGAPNTNFYNDVALNGLTGGGDDVLINQNSQEITKAIPGSGSSLIVRILFDSQGPQEEMIFDDVIVTATSVVAVCNDPSIPTLSSSPSTVCVGSSASINISGNLNDATTWHIYTGSCGGTLIGTTGTGTFMTPAINTSTTYFVRGEGGCVTPGSCGTITINPTAVDDASFSYSAAAYCTSDSDPSPTITGTTGGTFSSTFGLSLNPSNGFIDLSASTPGNYSIAYTTSGSCPSSSSVNVTINGADSANFNYSTFSYCSNGADVSPTISGTSGGTFTSSPGGLSINPSTGLIDLSASSPAFYQITYTTGGVCSASSNQFISISGADDANFSYSASAYCQNESDPTPTITGLGGGAFTSGAGLSINGSSGAIDVTASTPGAYTVTYTTTGSCPNSSTATVTINALDDASFSYSASAYCQNGADPTPTITGLGGGTFTSGAGLSINASSGAIDVSVSTPSTYTVTYTTVGTCPNSSTATVIINGLDDASFSYSASSYSASDTDPTPNITGLGGGSFSSGLGLVVNGMTGTIDLSASTAGTYLVTYTTTGTCPNSASQSVTIASNDNLATPTALVYGAGCTGSIYNTQDSTLELGEDIPDCAFDTGATFAPAQASSQWFTFVASSSGDALIKITDDGISGFGTQSSSIALTLALYEAPSTPGDVSTLGSALVCSSSSTFPGVELLDGTFIDAKGLTAGNTYYVQVYSGDNLSINYCIDVSEPVIYTYNNGWQAPNGNPELVDNPHKRVEVVAGDAVQQPLLNSGQILPPSVGSLYVAQNASVSFDFLLLNGKMVVDGDLNPLMGSLPSPTSSLMLVSNQSTSIISGIGKVVVGEFNYVSENSNDSMIDIDLAMDVYNQFATSDRSYNLTRLLTFKSNSDRTAVYNSRALSVSATSSTGLTGQVQVEQFIPENNSTRGRAYRFVSSPVASISTIYSQWQENGAATSGFGTHITGASGTAGMVDAATGLDQTNLGNNSMFTYSNNTAQSFSAVTSTNQAADSLKVAQAYLLYIRGDRNVDLTTNTSSSATVLRSTGTLEHKPISKSYDVEQGDFIFTGNPYQNAVDVEDLIDASTNIEDNVVYYWDPTLGGASGSGGAYVTYTGFDAGGAGVATPASANNGFIQPGQAVFVRANAGANGPTNDAVIRYRSDQADRNGLVTGASNTVTSTPSSETASISMSLYDTASFTSGNSLSDGLLIRFGSNYSNNLGTGDHIKFMNIDESVAIEQLGNNYAVAGRLMPVHDEIIQLNHFNYGDTDYTYTINVAGLTLVEAFVVDQFTNTITRLVNGLNTYNFTVDSSNPASIATDRFQLKFGTVTLGIGDTIEDYEFTMYPNPAQKGEVVNIRSSQFSSIDAALKITDLSGKVVMLSTAQFDAQGLFQLKESNLKTGLYIIELSDNDGRKAVKKLVID